jgi:hypothetical protein
VLAKHYRPQTGPGGPSWLTFIGHMKDSLWSVDLFRCESVTLKTHWVMVVMDLFTRRIIGFTCQLHKSSASERFRVIKNGIFGAKRRVA